MEPERLRRPGRGRSPGRARGPRGRKPRRAVCSSGTKEAAPEPLRRSRRPLPPRSPLAVRKYRQRRHSSSPGGAARLLGDPSGPAPGAALQGDGGGDIAATRQSSSRPPARPVPSRPTARPPHGRLPVPSRPTARALHGRLPVPSRPPDHSQGSSRPLPAARAPHGRLPAPPLTARPPRCVPSAGRGGCSAPPWPGVAPLRRRWGRKAGPGQAGPRGFRHGGGAGAAWGRTAGWCDLRPLRPGLASAPAGSSQRR